MTRGISLSKRGVEWGEVSVNHSPARERRALQSSALEPNNTASNNPSRQPTPTLFTDPHQSPGVQRRPTGWESKLKSRGVPRQHRKRSARRPMTMEQYISLAKYFTCECVLALLSTEDFFFFKEGKWNYNVELTGKPLCTPLHALHFSSSTCNPLGNGSISQGDDISLGRSAIWGETEGMHYTDSVGTQPSKLLAPGTEQKATSVCFTGGSRQTQNQTQPCN